MKKRLLSKLIAVVAIMAVPVAVPLAQAGQNSDTISIHFGADEPTQAGGSMLDPTDVTGAVSSANWNNATTNAGVLTNVVEDVNGVATASGAQVIWYASNTWASTGKGEENNNFVGADHKLMSGYLDMEVGVPAVTFIQINNLPASFSGTYDVYIYCLPGVAGRGGIYEVNGNQNRGVGLVGNYAYAVTSGTKDPTKSNQGLYSGPDFVEIIGDDAQYGADDFGNYIAFFQVAGPTVNITAVSQNLSQYGTGYDGTPRAAINGIQIVVD
jgi:hypothetical protein